MKRRVSRKDWAVCSSLLFLLFLVFWMSGAFAKVSFSNNAVPLKVEPRSDPYVMKTKTDPSLFNLNSFYNEIPLKIEIDVEPEFIETLNASVPEEKECKKIRYKKVPVNSIKINGQNAKGENWVRYRGFCWLHWIGDQKSLKISLDKSYRGYDTLNLNAFITDPSLFDVWTGQLMTTSGGLASRIGLARVYINGEFSGTRQLVENLDQDITKNQSMPKGMLVRELTHANMGYFVQKRSTYENFNDLESRWKKNSRKSASWDDFFDFQKSIFNGVRKEGDDEWKNKIDLDHYINYSAIQIISGTHHQNNHNIPVLLPGKNSSNESGPIIPVGYDFAAASLVKISRNVPSGEQVFGVSQNWLGSLIWSDENLRKQIDQRVIEILLEHNPELIYQNLSQRVKALMSGELSSDDLSVITQTERDISSRVAYLKDSYLSPKAHLTTNWKKKDSFQMYIDGLGEFNLELDAKKTSCVEGDFRAATVEVVRSRIRKILTECVGGVVRSKPIQIAETLVKRSDIRTTSRNRFMLGGLLLTFERGDSQFSDVKLQSNSYSPFVLKRHAEKISPINVSEDWPFHITVDKAKKMVSLGEDGKIRNIENNGGYIAVKRIRPFNNEFSFNKTSKNVIEFEFNGPVARQNKPLGPLICWKLPNSDTSCLEVSQNMLGGFSKEVSTASLENTPFGRKEASACNGNLVFENKTYSILQTVVIPKTCDVFFSSNSKFEFGSGASLIVLGGASFSEGGIISFTGRNGTSWGGVSFLGQESLDVRNVFFSDSTEFTWNDQYFTAALNVIDVKRSSIRNSVFKNIDADDALNVRGGVSEVIGNLFEKNRDGLDMDLCTGIVSKNIFLNQLDDGIDLGTAGPVRIEGNFIMGSGDKGVSIGEESIVNVADNLFIENNIGLANKDGSVATLKGNFYKNNNIGVSVYKKSQNAAEANPVEGYSYFESNSTDYKLDEKSTATKLVRPFPSGQRGGDIIDLIFSQSDCSFCTQLSAEFGKPL